MRRTEGTPVYISDPSTALAERAPQKPHPRNPQWLPPAVTSRRVPSCRAFPNDESTHPEPRDAPTLPDATLSHSLVAPPGSVLHPSRSEEHTSELQSLRHLVCRLL